jgi:AraC family transcriptional regulator
MTRYPSMSLPRDNHYQQCINAAIDYIRQNLTGDLSLQTLADHAGFSRFHFHRIFSSLMGETLADFVARVRLERAVALMKADRALLVSDAAFAVGYTALASFSRAFRRRYGMNASVWDRREPLKVRKNGQTLEGFPVYTEEMLSDLSPDLPVTVKPFPATSIAYIRVTNSYQPDRVMAAVERLSAWVGARGIDPLGCTAVGMSQDDPDVTPLELCEYDVCLSVPQDVRGSGEVQTRTLPACVLAAIHVQGDIFAVDRAWQFLYRFWLPRSRYLPDNLPAVEIYRRQPAEIGWEVFDMEAALPIVPYLV